MADVTVRKRPLPVEEQTRFRRDLGPVGILFVSVGSVIGSGWLLGSLNASQIAGPAALLSWAIAGGIILVLALIHAELGSTYPVAGGTARFSTYAFGNLAGFAAGWFAWIATVTLAPVETEAAIQYASNYASWLTHKSGGVPVLTGPGYAVAFLFLLAFTVINIWGIRRFRDTNNTAVWWKIAIPVLTLVMIAAYAFHGSNFTAGGGFAPTGAKGVLEAISTGGVLFALLGFEQAVQVGGESRNPRRNMPIAIIGSALFGVVLYFLLQVAFIGALNPSSLSHGWASLSFKNDFGPFAGLANALGLGWLAILLYIDAVVSPGGTGLTYTSTSARISYALGRNGLVPSQFGQLSRRGVPVFSIVFSFFVGMLLFLPFPGWQKLVNFISSATALIYGTAPLALAALRRQEPNRPRPFRLRAAGVVAPVGFVFANLIIYWSGWKVDWKLFAAVGVGFLLLAISTITKAPSSRPPFDWKAAVWLWPYLGGMALISYLGQFGGGRNVIPFWWDILVVAGLSLAIYWLALRVRLDPRRVRAYLSIGAAAENAPGLDET
ncbi:MAG TPA: APC family permease [Acidimicrobiales bacterium]|nr:APC family permease [Acidimicrobiales bacterium]